MSVITPLDKETRLRLVEALTRTDGTLARNQPELFIERVVKIETYVLNGYQAKTPEPVEEPKPVPKKGQGPKTEKAAPEVSDFME